MAKIPATADHPEFWPHIGKYTVVDVPDLIAEERSTRDERIRHAFTEGTRTDHTGIDQQLFDRMWLGEDLAEVNAALSGDFTNDLDLTVARKKDPTVSPAYDLYHLMRNTRLISFYHCFGSKSMLHPGRLTEQNEKTLLELLWWRTLEKNDIAIARTSTWWMAGSENHDLNAKVANLLTSAIFANEAAYAQRVYPNAGHDCAPGYGSAGYNAAAMDNPELRGCGRASWSDDKDHTPPEHLSAWVMFLTQYFAERARKGFFVENGAPGYMRFTISYILLLYNFCPDNELKQQARLFLDLFWTDWAIQQIGGLRGGPKTRHHNDAGSYDSMSDWARFYLGGAGKTEFTYSQQLIGDYEFSPIVWGLVFDRQGLGSFAYVSRGIGEEEPTCPRPYGVERTMMGDVESRFAKYSWVTPDYILGTQMDHPLALHNHLSISGRWQGLITSDPDSRVATVSLEHFPGKTREDNDYNLELMYHSVQSREVLITQQRRRWNQSNPDWFPAYEHIYDVAFGVFVGTGWETRNERDGWVFLQQDGTYVAIRVLRLKSDPDPLAFAKGTDRYRLTTVLDEDIYTWNENHTVIRLSNKYSPIIIEAGRGDDYPTLAEFERRILANKLEIHKTVATQETRIIVVYQGIEAEEIVFNAANPVDAPTVGGAYVDYSYPKTFDAPYLESDYGTGVVKIADGRLTETLDFNQALRREDKA